MTLTYWVLIITVIVLLAVVGPKDCLALGLALGAAFVRLWKKWLGGK